MFSRSSLAAESLPQSGGVGAVQSERGNPIFGSVESCVRLGLLFLSSSLRGLIVLVACIWRLFWINVVTLPRSGLAGSCMDSVFFADANTALGTDREDSEKPRRSTKKTFAHVKRTVATVLSIT